MKDLIIRLKKEIALDNQTHIENCNRLGDNLNKELKNQDTV